MASQGQSQNQNKASGATVGPWEVTILSHELLDSFTDGSVIVTAKGPIKVAVVTVKLKQLRDFNQGEIAAWKRTGSGAMSLDMKDIFHTKLIVSSDNFYLGYLEKLGDTPHLTVSECTLMKIESGRAISSSVTPKGGTVPTLFVASTLDEEIVVKLAFPAKKKSIEPLLFFSPTTDGQNGQWCLRWRFLGVKVFSPRFEQSLCARR